MSDYLPLVPVDLLTENWDAQQLALLSENSAVMQVRKTVYGKLDIKKTMQDLVSCGDFLKLAKAAAQLRRCSKPITEILSEYQDLANCSVVATGTFVQTTITALKYHKMAMKCFVKGTEKATAAGMKAFSKVSGLATEMAQIAEQLEMGTEKLVKKSADALIEATQESVEVNEEAQTLLQHINDFKAKSSKHEAKMKDLENQMKDTDLEVTEAKAEMAKQAREVEKKWQSAQESFKKAKEARFKQLGEQEKSLQTELDAKKASLELEREAKLSELSDKFGPQPAAPRNIVSEDTITAEDKAAIAADKAATAASEESAQLESLAARKLAEASERSKQMHVEMMNLEAPIERSTGRTIANVMSLGLASITDDTAEREQRRKKSYNETKFNGDLDVKRIEMEAAQLKDEAKLKLQVADKKQREAAEKRRSAAEMRQQNAACQKEHSESLREMTREEARQREEITKRYDVKLREADERFHADLASRTRDFDKDVDDYKQQCALTVEEARGAMDRLAASNQKGEERIDKALEAKREADKQRADENAELQFYLAKIKDGEGNSDGLQQSIACLKTVEKQMGRIKTTFANVKLFWQSVAVHSKSLGGVEVEAIETAVACEDMDEIRDNVASSAKGWACLGLVSTEAHTAITDAKASVDAVMTDLPTGCEGQDFINGLCSKLQSKLEEDEVEIRAVTDEVGIRAVTDQ